MVSLSVLQCLMWFKKKPPLVSWWFKKHGRIFVNCPTNPLLTFPYNPSYGSKNLCGYVKKLSAYVVRKNPFGVLWWFKKPPLVSWWFKKNLQKPLLPLRPGHHAAFLLAEPAVTIGGHPAVDGIAPAARHILEDAHPAPKARQPGSYPQRHV